MAVIGGSLASGNRGGVVSHAVTSDTIFESEEGLREAGFVGIAALSAGSNSRYFVGWGSMST